jgi:hypothetical protein
LYTYKEKIRIENRAYSYDRRLPRAFSLTRSIRPRKAGQSGRIPNSSITTSSTEAGTLRPGNSRNSFQKRFARALDHCAVDHRSRFGPRFTFSVPQPLLVACTRLPVYSTIYVMLSKFWSQNVCTSFGN